MHPVYLSTVCLDLTFLHVSTYLPSVTVSVCIGNIIIYWLIHLSWTTFIYRHIHSYCQYYNVVCCFRSAGSSTWCVLHSILCLCPESLNVQPEMCSWGELFVEVGLLSGLYVCRSAARTYPQGGKKQVWLWFTELWAITTRLKCLWLRAAQRNMRWGQINRILPLVLQTGAVVDSCKV